MSSKSKVLALKYRPQVFKDLIGQKVITETLINSLKIKKISNAYLFTGIRGVGKTTIARILAKSLNCKNGFEKICKENLCDNCKSITDSNHLDVLEMDAASKTGVDDIRDLIEFSRYGPSIAKFKIFIIDEVHMLSKQAFNALLKTLEEPPEYLKFIFATTEIRKIPITIISRCQRFDLSRIKAEELFDYLKIVSDKENGNITDEALKLIVKMSEGSVRDSLSLLDRAIATKAKDSEINLEYAQKIFGYFDRSKLIELIKLIFSGKEQETLKFYRNIYEQGVEPKTFLNDFLEILYYFKNIQFLNLENSNFTLNNAEFNEIKNVSNSLDKKDILLFWQFTIKTLKELDIVSDQNISIEMFLIRLLYLVDNSSINEKNEMKDNIEVKTQTKILGSIENPEEDASNLEVNKNRPINQIKNYIQEENIKKDIKKFNNFEIQIKSFEDLIKICEQKREIQLKYELETNVNLVKFEKNRIEISFNDKIEKNFIKDITKRLFAWTNERWIISLSKEKGNLSIKDNKIKIINKEINEFKATPLYEKIRNSFPDAKLLNIKKNKNKSKDE
tara:strand:- start:202 stop:1887 length:1686 start_codon:yes stop_codon:yes gene_type:complete